MKRTQVAEFSCHIAVNTKAGNSGSYLMVIYMYTSYHMGNEEQTTSPFSLL